MLTPSEGQELAIKFATDNKYSIIAMPPGQGKTLCGVEVAKRLKLNTLVICPSYARSIWVDGFKQQIPDVTISNFKKGSDIYPVWDDGVVILSYSLLLERRVPNKTKRADQLFEWADLVIFDESHLLKETDNQRTTAAHKLIYENRTKFTMLLSGTPAKNRVHELYSQVAICNYRHDNSSFLKKYPTWVHFANKFSMRDYKVIKTRRGNIPTVNYKGIKNLPELREILDPCYFKLPDKYLHKLPDMNVQYVEQDVMVNYPELYEEFKKFEAGNEGVTPDVKAQAALLTAKFTGRLAKDLLMQHDSLVIFTDHVDSCESIAENLRFVTKKDIRAVHGGVSLDKRAEILRDFQDGLTPAIVATTGTLSTAVSLTVSNVMIINDPPWVSGDLEQIERRILRRGQEKPCFYYRVLATKQSKKIYETVESKKKTLKKIDDLMESS